MENSSIYTTKDLNLAAFLWCFKVDGKHTNMEGHNSCVPEGGGKPVLYFKFKVPLAAAEMSQLVMSYLNGDCSVEPTKFAECQSKLKDIIYSQRG